MSVERFFVISGPFSQWDYELWICLIYSDNIPNNCSFVVQKQRTCQTRWKESYLMLKTEKLLNANFEDKFNTITIAVWLIKVIYFMVCIETLTLISLAQMLVNQEWIFFCSLFHFLISILLLHISIFLFFCISQHIWVHSYMM